MAGTAEQRERETAKRKQGKTNRNYTDVPRKQDGKTGTESWKGVRNRTGK